MGSWRAAIPEASNSTKRRMTTLAVLALEVSSSHLGCMKRTDVVRDEHGHDARSTASGRLPQDDYVQRWLAQTTQEVEVPSNAGLGSRKENGRVHLQFLSSKRVSQALIGCDADSTGI